MSLTKKYHLSFFQCDKWTSDYIGPLTDSQLKAVADGMMQEHGQRMVINAAVEELTEFEERRRNCEIFEILSNADAN